MRTIRTRTVAIVAAAALAVGTVGAILDRPTHGTAVPAPLAACLVEDGSTAGQTFPCRWDATVQGNGRGESYTLTEPATCAYARLSGPVEGC